MEIKNWEAVKNIIISEIKSREHDLSDGFYFYSKDEFRVRADIAEKVVERITKELT